MTTKPRIAIIIGSTRPTRFADAPARWMLKQAQARDDMEVELVDLRDHPLPFFDEGASNLWMPSKNPEAIRWQQTVGRFDGFIFVVAEYNHSITAALKNALDEAYKEWVRKPFAAIGYGGVGAARAIEHLRAIGVELQMVPVRTSINIAGPDFMAVAPAFGNQPIETIEDHLLPAAKSALDELAWWAKAAMAAKAQEPAQSAGERTPRVLLIGLKPDAVDYSDPDLPPGVNEEKVAAGIEATLAAMRGRGWDAVFCAIAPDETAEATVAEALRQHWDCIVVGGGVRLPSANLLLFERMINTVHRSAPGAPIAFNKDPEDSSEAVVRWLKDNHRP